MGLRPPPTKNPFTILARRGVPKPGQPGTWRAALLACGREASAFRLREPAPAAVAAGTKVTGAIDPSFMGLGVRGILPFTP